MPRPTLTATPDTATHTLGAVADSQSSGTYPGSDVYPGATTYPGRGSDLLASADLPTTDYIPATVPFLIQQGERVLTATPDV